MNAALLRPASEIEPYRLAPSEAARRRLARRLGHDDGFDELLAVSALYGVSPKLLSELYDYWRHDFRLEQQPLFALPGFRIVSGSEALRFWQVRSLRAAALPLLMLHGFSASLAEFAHLASDVGEWFHVVCPALDDIGGNCAVAAERCAELMRELGYERYMVHGSDSGAAVALELSALAGAAVAGVHVTGLRAYPSEAGGEQAALLSREKSQLAAISELYERLQTELPQTPLEALAFALSQLDEPSHDSQRLPTPCRDALLTGLSLSWSNDDATLRAARYRERCLAASPAVHAPIFVDEFPLAPPSLRRLAEARHRVTEWREHERGGSSPALEQPRLLLESLRRFAARLG
ncbi:MAG TPA: epoxide hydrolase N-terminal domain-containing protein [Polyangiaceae bacterium]|nr:epoxide hydrolase N-terminal domain-containing protein [Polyangiaceae bacterium]